MNAGAALEAPEGDQFGSRASSMVFAATGPEQTGEDARGALAIALASIEPVRVGRPVPLEDVEER